MSEGTTVVKFEWYYLQMFPYHYEPWMMIWTKMPVKMLLGFQGFQYKTSKFSGTSNIVQNDHVELFIVISRINYYSLQFDFVVAIP